jgi:hypothetical protein
VEVKLAVVHTAECLAHFSAQRADFNKWVDEEVSRLQKAGVDTSMRGFGYRYTCICGNEPDFDFTPADSRSQPAPTTRALPPQDATPDDLG